MFFELKLKEVESKMFSRKAKVLLIALSLCFIFSVELEFTIITFVHADNSMDNGDIVDARIVDRDTLKKKIDGNEDFVLLDARILESYEEEHIAGAASLPVNEAEKAESIIPDKNKEIITYCNGFGCPISPILAEKLIDMGYTNVAIYEGGIKEWKDAGYPTEKNEVVLQPTPIPMPTQTPQEVPTTTEGMIAQIPGGYLTIIEVIVVVVIILAVAIMIERKKGRPLFGEEC